MVVFFRIILLNGNVYVFVDSNSVFRRDLFFFIIGKILFFRVIVVFVGSFGFRVIGIIVCASFMFGGVVLKFG